MDYTVTYVGDDYCYGDGVHNMPAPTEAFTYGWTSCCWVSFTSDAGDHVSGGSMVQIASVNDVTNNSPSFKHPPLWLIMAGCDGAYIDLAPQDHDDDRIQCRWATSIEAGGAFTDLTLWPSLSLDQENCIVHYQGSLDGSNVGVKPIALMMEDLDADGNVRSSIPVQFLARVWTPNLQTRFLSYPEWFTEDDDHHEEHSERQVKQAHKKLARVGRSTPSYCTATPFFIGSTPLDGDEIDASSGQVSFSLFAESQIGTISSFSYQAPLGLICNQQPSDGAEGSTICSWQLTADQMNVEDHQFCFDATDSVGLQTERRCIVIKTAQPTTTTTTSTTTTTTTRTTTTTTTPPPPIRNIKECAAAILDAETAQAGFFRSQDVTDYGCAGRGTFEPFLPTAGMQLDTADHAFYSWKKCYQCATGGDSSLIVDYDYDLENDSCGKILTLK